MSKNTLAWLGLTTLLCCAGFGCATTCYQDATGTTCSAKSLKRYDGPVQPPQAFDRAPGSPLSIDVQYGNVLVERSASGKLEVQFMPFVYAGFDEQALASDQLAKNLRLSATANGVSVRREGGSNGLGADVVVRVPDAFDGPLTVVNRGDGPINDFDLKLSFVGRAPALSVTNQSLLGNCWVQAAPSVRSTTVLCGESISVFDVSDEVNITNTETRHDAQSPAVTLRLAAVSPQSRGGKVTTASGTIALTVPRAGGFSLNARAATKGTVQEGALPPVCKKQETSPAAKLINCGAGPSYEVTAGTSADYIGQPADSNVAVSYQ